MLQTSTPGMLCGSPESYYLCTISTSIALVTLLLLAYTARKIKFLEEVVIYTHRSTTSPSTNTSSDSNPEYITYSSSGNCNRINSSTTVGTPSERSTQRDTPISSAQTITSPDPKPPSETYPVAYDHRRGLRLPPDGSLYFEDN